MAVKATITIDETLMSKARASETRDAIRDAANDPLSQADIPEITEAFQWSDHEGDRT